MEKIKKLFNIKWTLVLYDAILYLASFILMFVLNKSIKNMQIIDVFINSCVGFLIVFLCRFFGRIYNQMALRRNTMLHKIALYRYSRYGFVFGL